MNDQTIQENSLVKVLFQRFDVLKSPRKADFRMKIDKAYPIKIDIEALKTIKTAKKRTTMDPSIV